MIPASSCWYIRSFNVFCHAAGDPARPDSQRESFAKSVRYRLNTGIKQEAKRPDAARKRHMRLDARNMRNVRRSISTRND